MEKGGETNRRSCGGLRPHPPKEDHEQEAGGSPLMKKNDQQVGGGGKNEGQHGEMPRKERVMCGNPGVEKGGASRSR